MHGPILDNRCDSGDPLVMGFSLGLVGSLIHILLVVAIVVILVRIIQGRKPL
jgi:hypothetical protein